MSEIPSDNQQNLEACIERAAAIGINHIETARGYGTSEMQLGKILPRLPREKLIVQTKVNPAADLQEFLANFEKSMSYLKLDYVNLHWYFVNPLNWPAVETATKRDMGVFIISPNDKGGMLQNRPEKMARLCAPLTPMQFNDLYCLARPEVHTLSIGVSRPTDFDEHVAALESKVDIAPIEQRLRVEMELDRFLGAKRRVRQVGRPSDAHLRTELFALVLADALGVELLVVGVLRVLVGAVRPVNDGVAVGNTRFDRHDPFPGRDFPPFGTEREAFIARAQM